MSISFETLALAKKFAKSYTDEKIRTSTGGSTSVEVLLTNDWVGQYPHYTQTVSVSSATPKSRIDLACDETAFASLVNDGVDAIYLVNDNGAITAHVIGNKPGTELRVQAILTEVN